MSEPVAYFCPHGCGCLWRENRDGSMSLYGRNSKSCEKCERLPLNSLLPLYSFDTIAALLNEVEHWKSEAASWEKQASDRVDDALKFAAERDALIAEVERLNSPVVLSEWQKLVTERDALIAEVRDREDVLERAGFRRCDISACNCGSWHQVGGFKARFDEIKEAIAEHVDLNGKTLLTAVQEALAERNALARDAARFDWYFGPNVLKPADFMSEYLRGVREQWTPDQWRAAIDAAMKGASDES